MASGWTSRFVSRWKRSRPRQHRFPMSRRIAPSIVERRKRRMTSRGAVLLACVLAIAIVLVAILRNSGGVRAELGDPRAAALAVDVATTRVQPMPVLLQAAGQAVSEH